MPFELPNPEKVVEQAMEKLSGKIKEREKPAVEKMLRQVFVEGKYPKDAIGLTPKEIENMYAYGYNMFTHGKYMEARLMMQHLMTLDPEDPRYPLGAGAAFQQMKNYEMAAAHYIVAHHLDPENPIPLYYMYECFKNLNEPHSALHSLEAAIAIAGDKPEHSVLKERATRTRDTLVQEVKGEEARKGAA